MTGDLIRGDDTVPGARVHPAMRAVLVALGCYKTVTSGPLATALGRPRPRSRTGFELDLTVEAVTPVAEDAVGLTLVGPDGAELPRWQPGAHLDVFLPSGRQRQYSLCGDPGDRRRYRIAVRLIRDGDGGSREIHQQVRAGDALRIRGPRNAFRLAEADSYHFVAGGIGITPILPMVKAAHARGKPWRLVYTGRTRASMPFLDELARLSPGDVRIRPDDEFGAPTGPPLLAGIGAADAVYVCGPPPMLAAARAGFGATIRELHTERFSPPPVVGGRPFTVELRRSGITVEVGAHESALAAIRRVVPEVPYSCQQGFCGSCRAPVLDDERHRSTLICVSRSECPLVLDL